MVTQSPSLDSCELLGVELWKELFQAMLPVSSKAGTAQGSLLKIRVSRAVVRLL